MRIKDIIAEYLLETEFFEMAFERKKAMQSIGNLQLILAEHLVKYFYFHSPNNGPHWESEIEAWLGTIDDIYLKGSKKLKPQDYYLLLFEEPLGEFTDVQGRLKTIYRKDSSYKNVPTKRTLHEVHELLEKLLHKISYDMSSKSYTTFRDYL